MGKIKIYNKLGKFIILLLAIVLLIHTSSASFASETILTTTVPSHFDIYIEITGQGVVAIGGKEYTENGVVHTERNKAIEIDFAPEENFYIEKVIFNDKTITKALQNNRMTIEKLEKDSVLSVVFSEKQKSSISKTGDNKESLFVYIALAITMSAACGVLLIKKKKE